jgi:hypothetical protein
MLQRTLCNVGITPYEQEQQQQAKKSSIIYYLCHDRSFRWNRVIHRLVLCNELPDTSQDVFSIHTHILLLYNHLNVRIIQNFIFKIISFHFHSLVFTDNLPHHTN